MFADNPDFFPTPRKVARRMLKRITNSEAKYYLEPSAGKGDIADVIKKPTTYEEFEEEHPSYKTDTRHGHYWSERDDPRVKVDVIENYPALIDVLRGKEYEVVGFDWLSYDGVSYYDAVLMNPPFSAGAAHLLKAWEFLHNGEIVCLLNEETLKNPHTLERRRLATIIAEFGDVEYLGDCFSTAERKTDVRVAMVYLKKVAVSDEQDLWAKKPTQEKDTSVEFDPEVVMLALRDQLGNMEHWYNMANEHWMLGIQHIRKAQFLMGQNKISNRYGGGDAKIETILGMALDNVHTCRSEFLRAHRKWAWTSVFEQMEFDRWLDSKQQDVFLRDVARDATIPFTAANIRSTLDNVWASRSKLFDESVARVFDELCSHAVENGSGPVMPEKIRNYRWSEGWKTNDNYKVNKKLIFPHGVNFGWSGFELSYGDARTIYSDLDRILCVLDGKALAAVHTIGAALERRCRELGKHVILGGAEFESTYFTGRFYKKGTVHLFWKREDLWERFNITAAAGKKWLGEDTQQYRPKRKPEPWRCEERGHTFEDGVCTRCDLQKVDPLAGIECEFCRTILEFTGRKHCPMHEENLLPMLEANDGPTVVEAEESPDGEKEDSSWRAGDSGVLQFGEVA